MTLDRAYVEERVKIFYEFENHPGHLLLLTTPHNHGGEWSYERCLVVLLKIYQHKTERSIWTDDAIAEYSYSLPNHPVGIPCQQYLEDRDCSEVNAEFMCSLDVTVQRFAGLIEGLENVAPKHFMTDESVNDVLKLALTEHYNGHMRTIMEGRYE